MIRNHFKSYSFFYVPAAVALGFFVYALAIAGFVLATAPTIGVILVVTFGGALLPVYPTLKLFERLDRKEGALLPA